MNTKHISFAFAVAAMLFASCAKSPIEESGVNQEPSNTFDLTDLELSHVGLTEVKSVIDGTTFPIDGEISLFLFEDEMADMPYGDGYENVMYSYNSTKGRWTASPSIKVGSTPGYLYGYYPYSSEVVDIKAIPVSSSLNGDDVMYASKQAEPITDATAANTAITMNHALARVSITVKNNGYTGDAKLTKIKFSGAEIAPEGTLDVLDGSVTATKSDVTLDVTGDAQTITAAGTTYECLLVPSDDISSRQSVNLTLTIDDIDKQAEFAGDNGIIFAQGAKSNITITLSNSGISVSSVSIDEWKEVEVGGYKVTVKLADEVISHDVLTETYSEGNTAKILAVSLTGRHLECTLTGTSKVVRTKSDDVYTFTVSSICENTTATIGYEKPLTVMVSPDNTARGTAKYEGSPYIGEKVTFTATAKDGYSFIRWQDAAGNDLRWTNPQEITLSSDTTAIAVFDKDGALSGVFTVAVDEQGEPTKKVRFSKGNLWYGPKTTGATATFNFESYQYETTPSSYGNRDNDHISHFMWCGTAEKAIELRYDSKCGIDYQFFTENEDFTVNGSNWWFTLSVTEWQYLLKTREMKQGQVRYTNKYNGVTIESKVYKGLFIYPDDYDGEQLGEYGAPDTWQAINSAGIVFLPEAGQRFGDIGAADVSNIGEVGAYWSSTLCDSGGAYPLYFISGLVTPFSGYGLGTALAVRLVTECQSEPGVK